MSNPFNPCSMASQKSFSGRHHDLALIKDKLHQFNEGNSFRILISGVRGIGKSSILQMIKYMSRGKESGGEIFQKKTIFAEFALTEQQNDSKFIEQIILGILSAVEQTSPIRSFFAPIFSMLKKINFKGFRWIGSDEQNSEVVFNIFLIKLNKKLMKANRKLIIIVDEADKAGDGLNLGSFIKNLHDGIDRQNLSCIGFIFCGLPCFIDQIKKNHPSVTRICHLKLGVMTKNDFQEILDKGQLAGKKNFTPAVRDQIIRLSSGYPYIIQLYAHSAFEKAQGSIIGTQDLWSGATCENGALDQVGKYFFNFELTDTQKEILTITLKAGNKIESSELYKKIKSKDRQEINNKLNKLCHSDFFSIFDGVCSMDNALSVWFEAKFMNKYTEGKVLPFYSAMKQIADSKKFNETTSFGTAYILAHTSINYLKSFMKLDIDVNTLKLIVCSPEALKTYSPGSNLQFLHESIVGWRDLHCRKKIHTIEVYYMDNDATSHLMIVDHQCGLYGDFFPTSNEILKVLDTKIFDETNSNEVKCKNSEFNNAISRAIPFNIDSYCESLHIIEGCTNAINNKTYAENFVLHRSLSADAEKKWVKYLQQIITESKLSDIKLLDVGAGAGRFSIPFSRISQNSKGNSVKVDVTGVDKSQHMVEIANSLKKQFNANNITFLNCDFGSARIGGNFNVVFVSDVLHLVPNKVQFFAAINEELQNEGLLIFRFHDHEDLNKLEWLKNLDLLETDKKRSMSLEQIKDLSLMHGFKFLRIEKIIESSHISRDEYFSALYNKSYSILSTIENDELKDKIDIMANEDKRDNIPNTVIMTMAIFQKDEEWYVPPLSSSLS